MLIVCNPILILKVEFLSNQIICAITIRYIEDKRYNLYSALSEEILNIGKKESLESSIYIFNILFEEIIFL